MRILKFLFITLLPLLMSTSVYSQKADELIDIKFRNISEDANQYLAIQLTLEKGWHVYWKNPGDSGIASDFKFSSKNKALDVTMLEWPAPKLYKEAGELWTFGYSGQHTFFANIKKNKAKNDELLLVAEFLVCKELCIPAKFTFNFDVKDGALIVPSELEFNNDEATLLEKIKLLPQKEELPLSWTWNLYHLENTTKLRLVYTLPNGAYLPEDQHVFTAYPTQPFNFRHFSLTPNQLVMEIDWDGQYQEPAIPLPADGKFAKKYALNFLWHQAKDASSVITINVENFKTINEAQWNDLINKATTATTTAPAANPDAGANLLIMVLFAILGGLILNFMPCVLPVISLKLYSLIHHTQKAKSVLIKHHAAYTLGIILSFWALAAIIIGIQQTGEAVGWGFQLQSPTFVWIMILLFFVLSLNLFGLFEFNTPGGKFISNVRSNHPYIDDFLAGLLAVIVATPCSAPFLGPALTFAFSTSPMVIVIMFTAMGIGLALPFIITALVPSTLSLLPRPGVWMNTFKFLMGLALLITCVWLFEVLQHLGNFPNISFMLFLVLVLIFFTIFIYQKEKKLTPLVIFMICFTGFNTYRSFNLLKNQFSFEYEMKASELWIPWNENKIEELLASKKVFFIDATAKWCITCQVNKKVVLETNDFDALVKKHQLITMRLDWTKKDENMFKWLQVHDAVSVPAYFLGINGKIIFLGETISISKIEDALHHH